MFADFADVAANKLGGTLTLTVVHNWANRLQSPFRPAAFNKHIFASPIKGAPSIEQLITAKHYLTAFLLVFCRVGEDEVSPPPPLLVILRL